MAITQTICSSFKQEILQGIHTLDSDTLKCALYSSSASLTAATTAYSSTNEITGTGYSAGGATLANVAITLDGTTAIIDFDDISWTSATFTARGGLIYNSSQSNKAIAALSFGTDVSVSLGTFTIRIPTANAANAIIKID